MENFFRAGGAQVADDRAPRCVTPAVMREPTGDSSDSVARRLKCGVTNMRTKLRVLILASLVAPVVVSVGFASLVDSRAEAVAVDRELAPATSLVTGGGPFLAATTAALSGLPDVPEGAKLLVIGGVLFGVAAAMRRKTDDTRH